MSMLQYEPVVTPAGQTPSISVTGAADPYALSRFFARSLEPDGPIESATTTAFGMSASRMRSNSANGSASSATIKRRRLD
jgi:hypothetical protein